MRDLCCFAERLDPDAVVDDQLVTLLAGESHRFRVRTRVVGVDGWRVALRAERSLVLRAATGRPARGERRGQPRAARVSATQRSLATSWNAPPPSWSLNGYSTSSFGPP